MIRRILLGMVAVVLVTAAAYAAFFVAPVERSMGTQRIFYFTPHRAGPRRCLGCAFWQICCRVGSVHRSSIGSA
jgi:hypothetical protein